MQPSATLLKNNNITAQSGASPAVASAIQKASTKTGVDFAYLMDQAKAESSYNPTAKAKSSSASGLFQFIERTWLDMVDRHGDKYGLGKYADAIDSKLRVGDKSTKQEILALRNDPQVASYMAAEFAAENKSFLEQNVGGEIGSTEMYFAHFLGAGGATGFLNELKRNPLTIAADIMPQAAKANRNVFYDQKTGSPRTMQEVYNFFDKKFSDTPAQPQNMLAKMDDVPTPMRKPVVAQPETIVAQQQQPFIPTSLNRSIVFKSPVKEESPVILPSDSNTRAMTLADYQNGANQIPARNPLLPAANNPLSIQDLLMLSAVDS